MVMADISVLFSYVFYWSSIKERQTAERAQNHIAKTGRDRL